MEPKIGTSLIFIGLFILIFGFVWYFIEKSGLPRLPGDIIIQKDNFTFYFPLVTSILLSILLTILFNLFMKK